MNRFSDRENLGVRVSSETKKKLKFIALEKDVSLCFLVESWIDEKLAEFNSEQQGSDKSRIKTAPSQSIAA
ncbi:MAG: hypothetical protein Kow00121_33890 [Elainellaceae cyanobacterium]